MKFLRLDLLTLLISLFILGSCKKQGTVNLGIDDTNQLEGKLIDTSTIIINTVREDSAVTAQLTNTPLSYFKDPVLGTTEANIALELNLPSSTAYTLPKGTIAIDSAVLVLNYANGFYGDSITTRYKANVYQLDERLYNAGSYTNNKKWKRKTTLVGTQSFLSRTHDSVSVIQPIRDKKDSTMKLGPQLRVPLNTGFVNSIFFGAPASVLASNLVFKNTVNGLYITLDKSQTGPGGTFKFNLDSAAVKVYYRTTVGTDIDTMVVTLPGGLHAAEIIHNYAGTPVAAELANTTTSGNTLYLQGLLGLRGKIKFPYLKNIVKTVGSDVIVNRAELVVSAKPGTEFPYEPLRRLLLYKLDLANQRVSIQDNDGTDPRAFSSYGGFYNSTKKEYHFLVTAYVQDLMRGKTPDYDTFIGAADPTALGSQTDISANPKVDGRTVAGGTDGSAYRIKLNIIYTKIGK